MNSNDMRKKVNGSPYHQFSILEDNRDMYMHVYSMAINLLLIIEPTSYYKGVSSREPIRNAHHTFEENNSIKLQSRNFQIDSKSSIFNLRRQ